MLINGENFARKKPPLGDFKVTTPKNPLINNQAITSIRNLEALGYKVFHFINNENLEALGYKTLWRTNAIASHKKNKSLGLYIRV